MATLHRRREKANGQGRLLPPQHNAGNRHANVTSKGTTPSGRHTGICPVCDGTDKLKVEPRRDVPNRWSVHCRSAECDPPGGTWLSDVAELVGTTPGALLDDPLTWLEDYLDGESADLPPDPLPTPASLLLRQERLWGEPSALAYLKTERRLNDETIRRAGIGWESDPPALVFPVYNKAGELVNVVRRPLPHVAGPKYVTMRGRDQRNGGVQLYPDVPEGSWLLLEGLLDALVGRQMHVPTVSPTHGVSTFLDEWLPLVKGKRIAVMFDVGVEQVTRHRVEQLNAAGADAWAVDLSPLLHGGKDLTDYARQGGTRGELVSHINRERASASRRRKGAA